MLDKTKFTFEDLAVYKKAYKLSMHIFEVSKGFPVEEKYALINQIRRSSRAVCAAIAEAYRKRMYEAHFISKTSDADMENSETAVWVTFAFDSGFISKELCTRWKADTLEIGRLLNHMIENPKKYQRGFAKLKK